MPHSQQHLNNHHHNLVNKHLQHQALFYRECDLKQDLSIANAKVNNNSCSNTTSSTISNSIHKNAAVSNHHSGTTWAPRNPSASSSSSASSPSSSTPSSSFQNDDNSAAQTPIHKIEARIAQMTIEDCAKEKIVLLLT
ncbi:hypothetical protein BGX24_006074, partial [Mortierella sp. AD032]